MKLGLGMIVKDEVEDLDRILTDYREYFDEVQITITSQDKRNELEQICQKFDAVASYFEWVNDFSAARNFNQSQFKDCDYYMTLDSDDEILNPEKIRDAAKKAASDDVSLVSFWYDYSRDADGNTNAGHYKQRLIRLDGNSIWQKRIHENVAPVNKLSVYNIAIDDTVTVRHRTSIDHAEKSLHRNLKYLLEEYHQDGEKTDPRTLAYLGRTLFTLGVFDQAIYFLEKHIEKSGWDEDRYNSWCYLAEIFRQKQDYEKAKSCCFEAIEEREDYPDAYLRLHDIYVELEDWKKAIHWGKIGTSKKMPKTFMLLDPSSYTWRPALSLAFCYLQIGEPEKGYQLFEYAKRLAPNVDFIKHNETLFDEAIERKQFIEKYFWIYKYLKEKDPSRIKPLIEAIPTSLSNHEILVMLRNRNTPPKIWDKNSIVFYCGRVFEEWGPPSVKTGIGGSEEAVIYLAKELARNGHQVTVFNDCGKFEGVYDGVEYLPHYKFNHRDTFNVLVSWRANIFKYPVKAMHRWIWLHDVPRPGWFETQDELQYIDKIIVLSQFHKSLLPKSVPEDKILVSANGINLEDFKGPEIVRNPKRVIYGSSYDRGLEYLLDIWPEVRKEVPEAELHIFYGWNNYQKIAKQNHGYQEFIDRMNEKMKQDGVFHHGRVGHKELIEQYQMAGVWAYPTDFPEISCITAMKAQAAGSVPVVTSFAALPETVKVGVIIPGKGGEEETMKNFKEALIAMLQNPEEQEKIRKQALKQASKFSWTAVAKQWEEEIKSVQTQA